MPHINKIVALTVVSILFVAVFGAISPNVEAAPVKSLAKKISVQELNIVEKEEYVSLQADQLNSYTMQEGEPILPVYRKTFSFPVGTNIKNVECSLSHFKEKHLSKPIERASQPTLLGRDVTTQSSITTNAVSHQPVSPQRHSTEYYEYEINRGINGDKQAVFLSVSVYPVQYNSAENTITYADTIDITVDYTSSPSAATTGLYDMVVVTPSSFETALGPLVTHKNTIGVETTLRTLDEIYGSYQGRDKQEQIKYFIRDALDNWGIKYVLLVGDENNIPVRYAYPQDGEETRFASDLYYSDIYNGNGGFSSWDTNDNDVFAEYEYRGENDDVDLYPDVYVGRLACDSDVEVGTVVNKIIDYENGYNAWFNTFVGCGGDTTPPPDDSEGVYEGEYLTDYITTNYLPGFETTKLYGSETESKALPLYTKKGLTKDNIKEAFNSGAGFINFAGHGNPQLWGTHPPNNENVWLPEPMGYRTSDISALSNGNKLPVVILNACSCGKFTEGNCIAWKFVEQSYAGSVATIATTALTWGYIGSYTIDGLAGYLNTHFFKAYNEGYTTLGKTLGRALKYYLDNAPEKDESDGKTLYHKTAEEFILFGDPSLQLGETSLTDNEVQITSPQKGYVYFNNEQKRRIGANNVAVVIGDATFKARVNNPKHVNTINIYINNQLTKKIEQPSSFIEFPMPKTILGLNTININTQLTTGETETTSLRVIQVASI